jgi:hypothetical protein
MTMEILSNLVGTLLAMVLFGTTAHPAPGPAVSSGIGMPTVEVWCTQPESAGDVRCPQ